MSRYRKIEVRTWSDKRFAELSPLLPSGQGLWFFLLTGPHTTAIPGLFRAGRAAMAEELGWELEAFDKAFAEVTTQGMAEADFKAKLVWLPNAIKHNKPESPNVVIGWRAEIDLLPECELKHRALVAIRAHLATVGPTYVDAFNKVVPLDVSPPDAAPPEQAEQPKEKPTAKALIKTSLNPMPNQEQEQEQEQDKASYPDSPAGLFVGSAAADEPPPKADRSSCPHQKIIELYHDLLPASPAIRDWTPARAASLRARWAEDTKRQNLDYWRQLFTYVGKSDFLCGRTQGRDRRPFLASLEWICKPENFAKIREGRYHAEEATA